MKLPYIFFYSSFVVSKCEKKNYACRDIPLPEKLACSLLSLTVTVNSAVFLTLARSSFLNFFLGRVALVVSDESDCHEC